MRRALAAPFRSRAPLARFLATLPPHQLVPSAWGFPAAAARASTPRARTGQSAYLCSVPHAPLTATPPFPPPAVPALSPTMATGVIAEWLFKEGDAIKSGSVIARVET